VSKRSQRQQQRSEQGLFDGLQDAPSLEESSDAIFGSSLPVAPIIKVKMVDIDLIHPDPIQPRRAVPSLLRILWNPQKNTFAELFMRWENYMEGNFNLGAYLFDGETDRSRMKDNDQPSNENYEYDNSIQLSFIRLLELASSILRDGLTNPISISRMGQEYMIETGERRWLAYQLLNVYFADDPEQDWSKIPARIMPERSVWRQATENNARQNLNAVSRARQLAILLMEIHGWENFRAINHFESEQAFYAQVSDGEQWRIPRDRTEQLLKAMGFNNQTQLRQYRAILRCDPDVWEKADDEDWTENRIRTYIAVKKSEVKNLGRTKKSSLDQAIADMDLFKRKITRDASSSKEDMRLNWQEFAQQQADWWSQLARKLDE